MTIFIKSGWNSKMESLFPTIMFVLRFFASSQQAEQHAVGLLFSNGMEYVII